MRDRSSLGYAEPSPDIPDFAQCGTCVVFLERRRRCLWLTPNKEVTAGGSCILYVQLREHVLARTLFAFLQRFLSPLSVYTPDEVGYVDEQVRCENCESLDEKTTSCNLYRRLNRALPDLFSLRVDVKKRACCNAFEKGEA